MKVLVTGYKGQLGYDVVRVLEKQGITCKGIDIDDLDLTNKDDVVNYLNDYNPSVIVHCAAYTQVDNAEDNNELAYNVNVNAVKYLTDYCKDNKIKLCFFSTDYVFDGKGDTPFEINSDMNPVNYYGLTKKHAEDYIADNLNSYFIIRISWVFGVNGGNFVKTMLNLASTRDTLSVVNDQFGSPTYTYDVANLVYELINSEKYGTYHATNEGICSWYEFASEIFRLSNVNIKTVAVDSSSFKTKAVRPKNSRMSKSSLINNGFGLLPTWQDALERYLKEIN